MTDNDKPCQACGHCPTCGRGGVFDWTWREPIYYGPYYVPQWWQPVPYYPVTSAAPTTFYAASSTN